MAKKSDFHFSGLLRCIINSGLITEVDIQKHAEEASKSKTRLLTYLVKNDLVPANKIAAHASVEFGVPFFDLSCMDLTNLPRDVLSENLIHKHHALPLFKRGNRLFIAVSDPTNLTALDDIKFHTRLNTEAILVKEDKLAITIESFLESTETSMEDMLDDDLGNIEISTGDEAEKNDDDSDIDDAPIVKFVNKILLDAIKKGASDIHLEPFEKIFRIRFRTDGMLHKVASPS
jgi:type IV pilus assembly protein PilB